MYWQMGSRALVTGATGFIGRRLLERLPLANALSRSPQHAAQVLGGTNIYSWWSEQSIPPLDAFQDVDAVLHLAGEPLTGGRWNGEKKRRIRESRVLGTRNLVRAIASLSKRPRVLVSASAVGYYGTRGDEVLDEMAGPGKGFLAEVCREWETEALEARQFGVRVITARIGVVLGRAGGALLKMLPVFRLGLGGRLGNGKQWMPWVHIDDAVGMLLYAVEHQEIARAMNVVAPHPVTNEVFSGTLAKVLNRPALVPTPAAAIRLTIGEFADVLLSSQRAMPSVAQHEGYRFQYPGIWAALESIVRVEKDHSPANPMPQAPNHRVQSA